MQHKQQPQAAVRVPVAGQGQMLCERAGLAIRGAAQRQWQDNGSPSCERVHADVEELDRPQPEGEGSHEQQQQHNATTGPSASHDTRSSPLSSPPTSVGISNGWVHARTHVRTHVRLAHAQAP